MTTFYPADDSSHCVLLHTFPLLFLLLVNCVSLALCLLVESSGRGLGSRAKAAHAERWAGGEKAAHLRSKELNAGSAAARPGLAAGKERREKRGRRKSERKHSSPAPHSQRRWSLRILPCLYPRVFSEFCIFTRLAVTVCSQLHCETLLILSLSLFLSPLFLSFSHFPMWVTFPLFLFFPVSLSWQPSNFLKNISVTSDIRPSDQLVHIDKWHWLTVYLPSAKVKVITYSSSIYVYL